MLGSDSVSVLSVQQCALCIVGHVSYMSASCCIMASIMYSVSCTNIMLVYYYSKSSNNIWNNVPECQFFIPSFRYSVPTFSVFTYALHV